MPIDGVRNTRGDIGETGLEGIPTGTTPISCYGDATIKSRSIFTPSGIV